MADPQQASGKAFKPYNSFAIRRRLQRLSFTLLERLPHTVAITCTASTRVSKRARIQHTNPSVSAARRQADQDHTHYPSPGTTALRRVVQTRYPAPRQTGEYRGF